MDFKRIINVAAIIFGFITVSAQAATYTPPPKACTAKKVTVPCEQFGWQVGFYGNFMRPHNDDLHFSSTTVGTANPLVTENNLTGKRRLGLRLNARYIFRQGHDIEFDWLHANTKAGRGVANAPFIDSGGITYTGSVSTRYDPAINTTTAGWADFKFDRVNAEVGQHFIIGRRYRLRRFVGVQIARLRHNLWITGDGAPAGPVERINAHDRSTFMGAGPVFGVSGVYYLTKHIGLLLAAQGAVLAGDLEEQVTDARTNASNNTDRNTIKSDDTRTVIPAGELNAGVVIRMPVTTNMAIKLAGGWHVSGMVHVIKHGRSLNPDYEPTGNTTVSNFGQNGPYLGVVVTG